MLECPLYEPIRDKFLSLFENVAEGSLKSSFQLDHQVDISLYLTEATTLLHSKELVGLKPSRFTFSLISLFDFMDFKINFIWLYFSILLDFYNFIDIFQISKFLLLFIYWVLKLYWNL